MSTETTQTADKTGSETTEQQEQKQEQTFTQADIDRIVRERLARQAKEKYGDYDDLKAKAEGAKSVEEKLAELAKKHADAEARALRSDIAARYGISAEDRDLFLNGTDETTLTAQAERLAAREADRKKTGNVAPKEGETKTTGKGDDDTRQFVRGLFGQTD